MWGRASKILVLASTDKRRVDAEDTQNKWSLAYLYCSQNWEVHLSSQSQSVTMKITHSIHGRETPMYFIDTKYYFNKAYVT